MKVRWPGWLALFSKTWKSNDRGLSLSHSSQALMLNNKEDFVLQLQERATTLYKWMYHWNSPLFTVLTPYLSL